MLITTRTKQTLIVNFQKLKEISTQFGLIISEQKTKYRHDYSYLNLYAFG
jgi:hypothetical protein